MCSGSKKVGLRLHRTNSRLSETALYGGSEPESSADVRRAERPAPSSGPCIPGLGLVSVHVNAAASRQSGNEAGALGGRRAVYPFLVLSRLVRHFSPACTACLP